MSSLKQNHAGYIRRGGDFELGQKGDSFPSAGWWIRPSVNRPDGEMMLIFNNSVWADWYIRSSDPCRRYGIPHVIGMIVVPNVEVGIISLCSPGIGVM